MNITAFSLRNFIFKAINLLLCLALIVIGARPVAADVYVKAFLEGADFSGRSLQGYQFNESDLRNASFVNADAQGVSFFAANMKEANLTGANLSNSTLDNARLDKADLTNVVLEGSFAYGTSFNNVIIDGADFTDVDLRPPIRQKLCQFAKGQNPTTGRLTRETLECK
ncbi:pentapeptide repeat-containing protein [Pseudanabaena sp. ABRG5-3]|uniref:pentapeptide repeat-containing protein n=1 Tax=Pseudanabaena sp. ABRG5-3 TaxID=685565 RepID=UPI000DC71DE0|nr:pentapeptide repeat-containing protein [Pseudanabaena sp. ABRG5-3]BBC22427.1 pentapeptide repeat-containing protein [Pseudanabaena sp. ABRG5-3]